MNFKKCSWCLYLFLYISKHTFHSERGGACRLSIVVLGLAAVDGSVLWEHLEQQQRVLVSVVKELALVAGGQSLGVFIPEHLRLRDAAHLHREASRPTRRRCLGLHVADDLGRLRHCRQRAEEMSTLQLRLSILKNVVMISCLLTEEGTFLQCSR